MSPRACPPRHCSHRPVSTLLGAALAGLLGVPWLASAQQAPPPNPLAALGAVPVPATSPLTTARIQLGQTLFWDEQLSITGTVACGSCHAPRAGGSDPRPLETGLASTHPGADGLSGSADDVHGAAGVPRHGSEGLYQPSEHFGMQPQVGSRQAPSAINAGYFGSLFWDGRAGSTFLDPDSQQLLIAAGGALENQALGPLVNDVEMAHLGAGLSDLIARLPTLRPLALAPTLPSALADWLAGRDYPSLFAEAFGDAEINAAGIAMALASYQRSLVADQTPLDAELSGTPSLTPSERAGRQVFAQAGCGGCHGGALLSDDRFHYIGVRPQAADPGRFAVSGRAADLGAMRSPSLRGVELSAPYMADGRFATLEEVIEFYDRGGDFSAANLAPAIRPLNLTVQQKSDLAAFLRRPLTDPRLLDASGPFEHPSLYAESTRVPALGSDGKDDPDTGLVPRLIALEPPLAGSAAFTIAVEQGRPDARAWALLDPIDPMDVDDPSTSALLAAQAFQLDAAGQGSINLSLPDDSRHEGVTLFLRVYVERQPAGSGYAITPAASFRLLSDPARVFRAGFE